MDRPTIKFTSRIPKRYKNKIQQHIFMRCLPSSQKTILSPRKEIQEHLRALLPLTLTNYHISIKLFLGPWKAFE